MAVVRALKLFNPTQYIACCMGRDIATRPVLTCNMLCNNGSVSTVIFNGWPMGSKELDLRMPCGRSVRNIDDSMRACVLVCMGGRGGRVLCRKKVLHLSQCSKR